MSSPAVTRADFQSLAAVRLEEAKALLDSGKWEGAYYLSGYAVELALKACIIKLVMGKDAFLEKKFSQECYTHSVETLMKLADLKALFDTATNADPILDVNWGIAIGWSEDKRYHFISEPEAKGIYNAIADTAHGVLAWIKMHW